MAQATDGPTKTCSKCRLEKPITEYWKDRSSFDGYTSLCKECDRIRLREWRQQKAEARKKLKDSQRELTDTDAEQLIREYEAGRWRVDQAWLLKELLKLYKRPDNREKLGTLKMIASISGYKDDTADERAVIDSLIESMHGEERKD